jgi:hypothetical protein
MKNILVGKSQAKTPLVDLSVNRPYNKKKYEDGGGINWLRLGFNCRTKELTKMSQLHRRSSLFM